MLAVLSTEHSSIVLIGADYVSSRCHRADIALLSSFARPQHVTRTMLLFSSLVQKRAGVGVGFRSVLMLARIDLNLCTQKPPTNFLSRRLQAKLSD